MACAYQSDSSIAICGLAREALVVCTLPWNDAIVKVHKTFWREIEIRLDYISLADFLSNNFWKFFYNEQAPTATVVLDLRTVGVVNASEGPFSSNTTASEHNSNEILWLMEKNNDVNTSDSPKNCVLLKTVKARVSQTQVHMMQLFSSHCYAALHLFKEMKLQIRNLTSL